MLSAEDLDICIRAHGFTAWSVIDLPTSLDPTSFDRMLSDGVGDMRWLIDHRELRLKPRQLMPGANKLLVVLLPYQPEPAATDAPFQLARYAAGKDYHKLFRNRLTQLGKELRESSHCPDAQLRATVDSAPVSERELASMAGLGWIGRNGLVIHPKRGSYHFIGGLFTSLPLPLSDVQAVPDRCGSCTACETGCPTRALVDRRVVSTRCISYLTIEHQGVIPRELACDFQGWWYGCDICQEVCPWNRFALPAGDGRLVDREPAAVPLHTFDSTTFDTYFAGSAIKRIGFERFLRNLLVAAWSVDELTVVTAILNRQDLPSLVIQQAIELELTLPPGIADTHATDY